MKKHMILASTLTAALLLNGCAMGTVSIVVPEHYAKLLTASDYDLGDKESGYKSKTKNDDGSVTYVMTRKQQKEVLTKISERIDENMNDTDTWDGVTEIKANDDYSHFIFVANQDDMGLATYLMPVAFVMLGDMYAIMGGNPEPETTYDFVDAKTGMVFRSGDDSIVDETQATTAATTQKKVETKPTTTATTEPVDAGTYEENIYYDVVEKGAFTSKYGTTTLIHKVLAKQDVTINATIIATTQDGNVVGKSSDKIVLTKGKYNYFKYTFNTDVSNAQFEMSAQAKKDSIFTTGDRNAVEMTQYNRSDDYLYVSFKQVSDNLDSFAKFKLLLYKGDQIVGDEDGYFNIYAENLTGNGSTDVASLWVYDKDYDRVEYVFEP